MLAQIGIAVPAGAAPAAITVTPVAADSIRNSAAFKTAEAFCPPGLRVIGGGGWVQEIGARTGKLALTRLRPVHPQSGHDSYLATGAETTPGISGTWFVRAYAMCAPPLPGLKIVRSQPAALSSVAAQATAAVCPAGTRALGSGASISTLGGQAVLQVARPSSIGDITRALAHEDVAGYSGDWSVTAYAVCANPPAGYEVKFVESPESHSEFDKVAEAQCPPNKKLLSSGAALSNVAPASVSLTGIIPSTSEQATKAEAMENTPTNANWDSVLASVVCLS
jgi:hypothetical protein